jgi:hypothetical protein
VGRKKKYDVVKSIRIGLSQLEKTWLESHSSQSELINSLIRREMAVTKTLNPKIEEIVCRAIARLATEGIDLNFRLPKNYYPGIKNLEIVYSAPNKSRLIPIKASIVYLGVEVELDGRGAKHWYYLNCEYPIAITVYKSELDENDTVNFKSTESIPEWMLAQLAIEQKPNG